MATPISPSISKERRLFAFIGCIILTALAAVGWESMPHRGTLPPTKPLPAVPMPAWAGREPAWHWVPAHMSPWPVPGGDGSVRFVDVTQKGGIQYQWIIPGIPPYDILQTIGNGCAFLDYDGDGNLDALLVGTDHVALFRGDGHGHFADVSHALALDTLKGHFLGCAVGDYDNDGFEDVYISGYRTGLLLHNEGGKRFTDVTAKAGLKPQPWGTSAAWAEIVPGSGRLDLFVANYARFDPHKDRRLCLQNHVPTSCGPLNYSGVLGVLYQNQGGGKFRDVSQTWHPSRYGRTLGAAFADYDGSGRPGLALANDEFYGELHQNMGNTFQEVGQSHGVAVDSHLHIHGGMGLDWGDYDNDGRLDQAVGTFENEPKSIYHNEGGGLFKDVSDRVGLADTALPYVSFGVKWIDFDNSGWLGLMIASGHVGDDITIVEPSSTYHQPTMLFRNRHGKRFDDLSTQVGPDLQRLIVGRGLAIGDFDNDGRVDALVVDSSNRQGPLLLRNQSTLVGHWLSLTLIGTKSNRDGIGARVTVTAGRLTQMRLCHTDGSYLSASDKRVHLGLDKATRVDRLQILWPSGHTDTWKHLRVDQPLTLREGTGKE